MRWAFAFVCAVSLGAGCCYFQHDGPKEHEWGEFQRASSLDAKQIDESSGVARSYAEPGTYLTHNDSGDKPRFFRFNLNGKVTATYDLKTADAFDWEDLATAKVDGTNYVYLGDIGDNAGKRENIVVYRVIEPKGGSKAISNCDVYNIKYPDGPHNCETLVVMPGSGDLYLVTKTSKSASSVYKLAEPRSSGTYTLTKIGEIKFDGVLEPALLATGGDIAPDGKHLIVRNYIDAIEFDIPAKADDWVKSTPKKVVLATEVQGEAIGYSLDGKSLVTTSEGVPCPISVSTLK